jgi:hypothetical protein
MERHSSKIICNRAPILAYFDFVPSDIILLKINAADLLFSNLVSYLILD